MIEKIEIEGYKSIRAGVVHLNQVNILIGANGAGKSNFMQIFPFLNAIVSQQLNVYVARAGGAGNLLFSSDKVDADEIKIVIEDRSNQYDVSLLSTDEDRLFIANEYVGYYSDKKKYSTPYVEWINGGAFKSRLRNHGTKVSNYTFGMLSALKVYHFHNVGRKAKMHDLQPTSDNISLQSEGGNIAAVLLLIKDSAPGRYQLIEEMVRRVFTDFDRFFLREENGYVQLRWRKLGAERIFNSTIFSDGTMRFILLATLLLHPNLSGTIIVDEPELGLHPSAIHLLAALVHQASEDAQIIMATQSMDLLNEFQPEDILIAESKEGETAISRLDKEKLSEWLADYSLGQLWEKDVFGGNP